MKHKIKTYIKGESNHLMLLVIGFQIEDKFTGIIVYNNTKYVINNNIKVSNSSELMVEVEPSFEEINRIYKLIVFTEEQKFNLNNLTDNEVYHSKLNGKDLFFTDKKTARNQFSFDIKSILKEDYLTEEYFENRLSAIDLNLQLMDLERMCLNINASDNKELKERLTKVLNCYGFSLKKV